MKLYEKLSNRAFRRKTGVKKETFWIMVDVVNKANLESKKKHKSNAGRPRKLGVEESVLLALEYWREYRTYFSLAQDYGVAESTVYEMIREVEDALSKDDRFKLPDKKVLKKALKKTKTVAVDSTECPIERPKKNKSFTTLERKKSTLSRCSL